MTKNTAPLNKIIKFSNVDGPGNRMAIFFQECNFNCRFCHNPETINLCKSCKKCVSSCPTSALSVSENDLVSWDFKKCVDCDACIKTCPFDSSPKIKNVTVDDLVQEIKKIKSFIKGITVSGGESTLRYEFLTELFTEVKKLWPELTCFVDTNGSLDLSNEKYSNFVSVTDAFMLDVKAVDEQEHLSLIEAPVTNVLKNLDFLISINKLYEVRTVVIPEVISNESIVEYVSKKIANSDTRYKIIKYRSIGVRNHLKDSMTAPKDEYMDLLKNIATTFGVKNILII